MQRIFDSLMSAAYVIVAAAVCALCGTPRTWDEPMADGDEDDAADDLASMDGEPRDVREMTRYVLFVDSLGSPLPPVVVARMMHEQAQEHHNG